tara:strand:+ start:880 stop:2769 length:1890 start_codon:yes stop_codon:yes gene_type:complete
MRDRRKAKKDLEDGTKLTGQFIQNFLLPRVADEDRESYEFEMMRLEENPDISPSAKAQGYALISEMISQDIVNARAEEQVGEATQAMEDSMQLNIEFIQDSLLPNVSEADREHFESALMRLKQDTNLASTARVQGLQTLTELMGKSAAGAAERTQMEALREYIDPAPPVAPAPTVADFSLLTEEQDPPPPASQKKNTDPGSRGPVGEPGPQGPAAPPIKDFLHGEAMTPKGLAADTRDRAPVDFSILEAPALNYATLKTEDMQQLLDLVRPQFPDHDLELRGGKVRWHDTVKASPSPYNQRMKQVKRDIAARDFLSLPQNRRFLERNHPEVLAAIATKQNAVVVDPGARRQAIESAKKSSRPYTGRFAQLQGAPIPPAPAPRERRYSNEENAELAEAKALFADGPATGGEIPAALSRRDRAEALIRNYFDRAGDRATMSGLQNLVKTAAMLEGFTQPASEQGEPLNETHTEKLFLKKNLLEDMEHLVKVARESEGKATGRLNRMLISLKKGVGVNIGPEATALEQAYYRVANALIKARSGAAVSAQEMERVMEEIGRMEYADAEYLARMEGILDRTRTEYQTSVEGYSAMGYYVPPEFARFATTGSSDAVNSRLNELMQMKQALEQKNR